MAVFNPEQQNVQEPDWWRRAHAIEQPKPDQTSAIAIKGITDVAESGLQFADSQISRAAANDAYEGANAENERYFAELRALDPLTGGKAPNPKTGQSLISAPDEEKLPYDIEHLSENLTTFGDARANGKISKTTHDQYLYNLVTDLRTKYPAQKYKDIIDQKVKEATGVIPANAYMNSMIADINSWATYSRSDKDKVIQHIWSNPGAFEGGDIGKVVAGYERGDPKYSKYAIMTQIGQYDKYKADLQMRDLEYKNENMGREEANRRGSADVVSDISGKAALNLNAAVFSASGEKILDVVNAIESGKISPDDESAERAASYLSGQREKMYWDTYADWHKMGDNGEPSKFQKSGMTEASFTDSLNKGLAGYDKYIEHIRSKEAGPAFLQQRMVDAQARGVLSKLQNDPDVGPMLMIQHGIAKGAGSQAAAQFMLSWYGITGMPKVEADKLTAIAKGIMNQGGVSFEQAGEGTPAPRKRLTFRKSAEMSVSDGDKSAQYWDNLVKLVNIVPNTKASLTERINTAHAAFNKENYGFTTMFDKQGRDPANPDRTKPGDTNVFATFASPKMAHEIKKLSSTDPSLAGEYQDWVGHEWGQLFGKDVADLKEQQKHPYLRVFYNEKDSTFDWVWGQGIGPQKPRFMGRLGQAARNIAEQPPEILAVEDTFNRINDHLKILRQNMNEFEEDPSTAVMRYLVGTLQWDPTEGNIAGIPQQIRDAIIAAKNKPEKAK